MSRRGQSESYFFLIFGVMHYWLVTPWYFGLFIRVIRKMRLIFMFGGVELVDGRVHHWFICFILAKYISNIDCNYVAIFLTHNTSFKVSPKTWNEQKYNMISFEAPDIEDWGISIILSQILSLRWWFTWEEFLIFLVYVYHFFIFF